MKPRDPSLRISDFMPRNVKIFLPNEQRRVLLESVDKFGSEDRLARYIGVSRSRINDWKFERSRIDLGYYIKLKEILSESIDDNFHFQTHKRNGIKISQIKMSKELSWLLGFRQGDRDEDKYSIGIGTSDPEIAIEFIRILRNLIKNGPEELWCQITVPKDKIKSEDVIETKERYSIKLGLPRDNIRVRPRGRTERHKRYHIVIRYYNMLIKRLFINIEREFDRKLQSLEPRTQGQYLKGLIDSEGTIYNSGRIVITMRPSKCLDTAYAISKRLVLDSRFYEYPERNFCSLVIYGPASLIMNLCYPVHNGKACKLRNCTQFSRMG